MQKYRNFGLNKNHLGAGLLEGKAGPRDIKRKQAFDSDSYAVEGIKPMIGIKEMNKKMKIKTTLIAMSVACLSSLYSQSILENDQELYGYDQIHGERVYIHHNSSLLFSGENLYYSLYCLNQKTNRLSSLSKIGYVELLGENEQLIFRHKIKLISGLGQGNFFVPTTVPSGNYKLLGYTQWMKNSGKDYFFNSDISIINPYQGNQNSKIKETNTLEIDSIYKNDFGGHVETSFKNQMNPDENIKLVANKKNYGRREQVRVLFQALDKSTSYGNYSISVRKISTISEPRKLTAKTFMKAYQKSNYTKLINDYIHLPELRGELLSGKVVSKTTELAVKDKKVALSILGSKFVIDIANTNAEGTFYFNLKEDYDNKNAQIQVVGDKREDYKIVMDQPFLMDYRTMTFDELVLTPRMSDLILERSIHNQIENAYLQVKPDTVMQIHSSLGFYHEFPIVYNLDDYTRFTTMDEVIVEIIDYVWTDRKKNGDHVFRVRDPGYISEPNLFPLIIVDGVLIQKHEDIMDFNARKIKAIKIFRDKLSFGMQKYQGVVYFETLDGNFQNILSTEDVTHIELLRPLPTKKYFRQNYDLETKLVTDHIPDYRHQLLWMPNLKLNTLEIPINFFTSDVSGTYEICLEGFTLEGEPVSLKELISVN